MRNDWPNLGRNMDELLIPKLRWVVLSTTTIDEEEEVLPYKVGRRESTDHFGICLLVSEIPMPLGPWKACSRIGTIDNKYVSPFATNLPQYHVMSPGKSICCAP